MEETEKIGPSEAGTRVVEVIEAGLGAEDIDGFCSVVLPLLCNLTAAASGLIYVSDPRLRADYYHDRGFPTERSIVLQEACGEWLEQLIDELGTATKPMLTDHGATPQLALHPLPAAGRVVGIVGIQVDANDRMASSGLLRLLLGVLARVADNLVDRVTAERKILHLNTYLTVSSMLARSVDLAELLEVALYCSMEAVSAEAASILLLDEAKENFRFYRVEGAAKPVLGVSTFPATEGVAGRVLETLEAEIVNDAQTDEQFYGQIDRQTGFRTRNMIAVPLVAGEELIGVLEVLNRANGSGFSADERLILVSVADEVAFAVRNATIFDYVVNTYCKRRQGQSSCKECERPLGSWTPCMRYREFLP